MKVIIKNNKEETLTGIIYEKDPIDPIEKIKEKNFNDILNFYFTNNVNFLDIEEDDFLQEVEFKKTKN